VDAIPRMLLDSWMIYYDRMSRYDVAGLPRPAETDEQIALFRKLHKETQDSFSFEWLRYKVTDFDENRAFFNRTMGVALEELEGKLVLDACCGMGRFLEVTASAGAEVVGLDLSLAVERAWRETTHRERVHFVQADVMMPPLRAEVFDFVYSIGALHHTPDTRRAFRSLCPTVRPGGRISVWLYRTFQPEIPVGPHKRAFAQVAEWTSDGVRLVTTRLPHRLLHYLCYSAVPLGWLRYQVDRSRFLKYVGWPVLLLPISAHPKWRVRLCDTFDWLAPKYQWKHTGREVVEWFRAEGFTSMRTLEWPVSVTGVKAVPAGSERQHVLSRGDAYAR
jgi:SAM-dependent methyltransferase